MSRDKHPPPSFARFWFSTKKEHVLSLQIKRPIKEGHATHTTYKHPAFCNLCSNHSNVWFVIPCDVFSALLNGWELHETSNITGFLTGPHVVKHVLPIGCNSYPTSPSDNAHHVLSALLSFRCFCLTSFFIYVSNVPQSVAHGDTSTWRHATQCVQRTMQRVVIPKIDDSATQLWYASSEPR